MRLSAFFLVSCVLLLHAASIHAAFESNTNSTITNTPSANTSPADSTRLDSNRIRMLQYIGATSTMTTDHRTLGIPAEYAAPYGNAPLASVGVNVIWIGDLLFKTNKLRSAFQIEKFLNVYPSSKLLENWRFAAQFGYYFLEQSGFKVYPTLGYGTGIYYIDNGVRMSIISVEGGAGLDYCIPKTPLLLSIQAAYSHNWNLRAAKDVSNNVGGLAVRAQVSFFIREKFNYWGWD